MKNNDKIDEIFGYKCRSRFWVWDDDYVVIFRLLGNFKHKCRRVPNWSALNNSY